MNQVGTGLRFFFRIRFCLDGRISRISDPGKAHPNLRPYFLIYFRQVAVLAAWKPWSRIEYSRQNTSQLYFCFAIAFFFIEIQVFVMTKAVSNCDIFFLIKALLLYTIFTKFLRRMTQYAHPQYTARVKEQDRTVEICGYGLKFFRSGYKDKTFYQFS